jgi:hypothetical protein
MIRANILVGGATGRTGRAAIDELLKISKHARAYVRTDHQRVAPLKKRGVDIAIDRHHPDRLLPDRRRGVGESGQDLVRETTGRQPGRGRFGAESQDDQVDLASETGVTRRPPDSSGEASLLQGTVVSRIEAAGSP